MKICELRQVRKEAAVSKSFHVPQGSLAGAVFCQVTFAANCRQWVHGQIKLKIQNEKLKMTKKNLKIVGSRMLDVLRTSDIQRFFNFRL